MNMNKFRNVSIALALAISAASAIAQVTVGGAQMYPSKDIIDNAINSKDHTTLVAAIKAAGLVDTLKGPGPFTVFAPTNAAFDALPAEYKAMVEAAASHAHVDMQAKYDARNPIALKELVAKGTKLRPFTDDVMNAAFKVSNELYSELSAKNPGWKKIYEDYIKFRGDQNLWFRFAEARFDRFMQTQKL